MKHIKTDKQPGVARFFIEKDINLDQFISLMGKLASLFSANVDWIPMPEAEVGKIKSSAGEIYAKFDFVCGLELDCSGFTQEGMLQIEAALSASWKPIKCSNGLYLDDVRTAAPAPARTLSSEGAGHATG